MNNLLCLLSCALAIVLAAGSQKYDIPEEEKWMVTKTVFFNISIDLDEPKTIKIGLFGDAAPNTVNNFAALAKGAYRGDVSLLLLN